MSKHLKSTRRGLTSLDGKRTITAREFERLFDEGSDEIDQFIDWSTAAMEAASAKKPITLRLDADVLDWFKSFGPGYQTRINTVLRSYKRAREKVGNLVLVNRKARIGRNPATGEQIKIPANKVVEFRVAKAAKDAILGSKK